MALPHIQVGDNLLADALLASVEVRQELNQHWWCSIVCRQTEDRRIPVEDYLGQPLEIKTTDQDGVEHTNFAGFVLDVELDYEVWGSYTATITAVSDSYKLDLTARKQYYPEQTLSSVASTVAGRDGLSIAVNGGESKALNYVQYGETDFSFLNRIVDDYACWMRPKKGGLEVFGSFQSGGKVMWRGEDGLLSFRIKGTLSPASVNGSHYDFHAMQSSNYQQVSTPADFYDSSPKLTSAVQSQSQALPPAFVAQRARVMSLDNYQAELQKESQRSIGGNISATGQSRNQQLMAGDTVEIEGNLEAKGIYGLTRVIHRWETSGYINTFTCTPWKTYRNPSQPAMREWFGVVPARVVDHHDPKKMGRLKLQFFWQDEGATHWARMVSPHAGPDRGFMFMPEVGDEVAVVFEDGDPERPVILGSMWNGVQQAPRVGYVGAEADIPTNDVKRIYTKSGNRMQMVDTSGKETVVLATPNNSSMTLSEKHDSTGRPLVHIHSEGDIVLTAPNGRVHIQGAFFSREVGDAPKKAEAATASAVAALSSDAPQETWIQGFGAGLWGSTVAPLINMVEHPIKTIEGIGHVIAHPVNSAKAIGHAIHETGSAAMQGDGRAIGTSIGSVGMLFVPGADVAEGAEDVARVGKLGEVADAAKVGDVADASAGVSKAASWQDLKAANAADVDNVSTFKTVGVSDADAASFLNTSEGQQYLDNLQAGSPTLPPDKVYQYAKGQVMSGSELPTQLADAPSLYKIVPQGETPSVTSPYYMTKDQLNQAIGSGNHLGSEAGLPLKTHVDSYDVFRVDPSESAASIYQSPIAPTSELNGAYTTNSSLTQSLLTNKTGWSAPQQVGSVPGTGGVPLP
jgi:type VI secretion system secreted protein VgrG